MILRPLSDTDASEEVRAVFDDAKELLGMSAVPLMLRFIANAQPYLFYLWESMQFDLQNDMFRKLSEKLISFSLSSVSIIYTPSSRAAEFTTRLSETQRKEFEGLLQNLLKLNSIFFLFSLDLREDLKTAFTKVEDVGRLSKHDGMFSGQQAEVARDDGSAVMASRMLAPLFGTTLPELPKVETFFEITEAEMERLGKTEAYLKTRVELERVGLMFLSQMPRRMNSNYKVFMGLIEDTYVAYDMLYLLTNVFPSEFPRLLLTTALMQRLLEGEVQLVTQ